MSTENNPNPSELNEDPNAPIIMPVEPEERDVFPTKEHRVITDELINNVKKNLLSGPGRLVFIILSIVLIIVFLTILRSCTAAEKTTFSGSKTKVDSPPAPKPVVENESISQKEHERRKSVSALEAQQAAGEGKSYIPPFDTNVQKNESQDGNSKDQINNVKEDQTYGKKMPEDSPASSVHGNKINQLSEQQQQERIKEYQSEIAKRDAYVRELKNRTLDQMGEILGKNGKGGLNKLGTYTQITLSNKTSEGLETDKSQKEQSYQSTQKINKKKVLIKAGTVLYGATDGAVNTDEGNTVLATIAGGEWDNAALIGKVQAMQDNINLIFTVMSPRDNRPKLKINAMALRLEDAGQGIADTKDYHTIERWGSLAASSLMGGYGKSFQNIGTTVNNGSSVVQTKTSPNNKEIVGNMVGELGTNGASEVMKGFNRPTTYSTEQKKGFALYFLDDAVSEE